MKKRFVRLLSLVLCAAVLWGLLPSTYVSAAVSSFAPTVAEWEVVKRVNKEREKQGLYPLTAFAAVQDAADIRANELLQNLAHDRPDGSKFYTVFPEVGLEYSTVCENIAWGYGSASSVMSAWMNSSGHYANIMNKSVNHIGVGRTGNYWVQLFIGHKKDSYKNYFELIVRDSSYEAGTTIEEMDMYAILVSSKYGDCYLPILSSYCTGYDPALCKSQTVTVSALGFTDTVKITIDGHKEVVDEAVAATCTDTGLTEGKHCSVCGEVIVKQKTVAAKGHSYSSKVIAPTCAEKGYTTYTCSACGDSYKDNYKDATGKHTYQDDYDTTCEVCGHVREVVIKTTPMYRLYNPNSGEHFYTGSTEERDILVVEGWNYEGVAFNFPVVGEPVYRAYEPFTGEHLYTMDQNELSWLLFFGWNYEGVCWNSAGINEVPQYRLHNPNATVGAYHFTGSTEERDMLIAAGWEYQGIGWYSCLK